MSGPSLIVLAELARPTVTADDAAELALTYYRLAGEITELGSQQDRNFRITTADGRYILKICRAEYAKTALEAQNAALQHLREMAADVESSPLRFPRLITAKDNQQILNITIRGVACQARLFDYLEGETLTACQYLSPQVVATFGTIAARIDHALAGFDHPGLAHETQWDLRQAESLLPFLLQSVSDQDFAQRLKNAMMDVTKRLNPLRQFLRIQPIHNDITDDNLVGRRDRAGRVIPDGTIDFGDLVKSWLVAELAISCASLLNHAQGDPFFILPAIKAYQAIYLLNREELRALWPLIVARAALLTASSEQQLSVDPGNQYVRDNAAHERVIFEVATSVPMELMEAAIFVELGLELESVQPEISDTGRLFQELHVNHVQLLDLSVSNSDFTADNWSKPDFEHHLLRTAALESGYSTTRYGEFRLTRTGIYAMEAPESCALHVDLCLPAGEPLIAPFSGVISGEDDQLILVGEQLTLHLGGVRSAHAAGIAMSRGEPIGTVTEAKAGFGLLRVQVSRISGVPPLFAKPHQAAAWTVLSPSPAELLGFACDAPPPISAALMDKRKTHLADTQKHYYQAPPQIERGWKEHLIDIHGRSYLDMVNNVTTIGHGHPRLADAVQKQWLKLNTNSRFHYAAVADFSQRLADLAPQGLDTVFLVNSGSEANDLALRLAWAWSGSKHMLCLLEAYHGWTIGSDAVSTSIADNPNALDTRPDWVYPVVSPNTYRGGANNPQYLTELVTKLQALDDREEKLAGFICEPVYGNAGGISLPQDYLAQVYAEVRKRGGLCIADEVQVGYGRLGQYFWGFEQQGVVPDVITIAKGMGNGHPLGAVITRREIADALEREGYFFSSAGGSPVSCVVGSTVLDIIEDEGLQQNARSVGSHLKQRLEALQKDYPLIGAVHGMGLYLGVEFIRDYATLEPASFETAAICDRMLDLGVIMQPTGDHLNILKIKPPLCLTISSADYFADVLQRVLEEGW